MPRLPHSIVFTLILITQLAAAPAFDFGPGPSVPGRTRIPAMALYSKEAGYGFEPGATLQAIPGAASGTTALASSKPFLFHIALAEGNYKVTVTLGDPTGAADTTVSAELRRLMLERIQTEPGQFLTRSFIVNVRTPVIAAAQGIAGGRVGLKDREKTSESIAWDDRLTLEFNGSHPAISSLTVEKVDLPMLYLLGDSTVCDQPTEPFNSWGQMITRFMKPTIAIANHSESGESVASSLGARRFNKIWSEMKKGDYLFVQFGHNDMKATAANALDTYTNDLRRVVDETRGRGGIPVLFTPVSRRTFNAEGKITNSFNQYPDRVKLVAKEKEVPLIDLQLMAAAFYESMGDAASHKAFANQSENTHHSDYGSYEIAQCVLQAMKDLKLPLAEQIVDEFKSFDPSHPDRFEDFKIPTSLKMGTQTPLGN